MAGNEVRIAICDDDGTQREYLSALIGKWPQATRVNEYASAEEFLFSGIENTDILLLDVQMPGMDGMALAHALRERGSRLQIIFISGYPDYMQDGYDVEAVHYLLKPLKEDKLFSALERARDRLLNQARAIVLRADGEDVRIIVSDILYAEADGHCALISVKNGDKIRAKMAISELESKLGKSFFRCQRSFLVGMRHAARVTRTAVVLDDGQEIPLARGAYDAALRAFIDNNCWMTFMGRRMDRRIAAYQNELVGRHADEVQSLYREMRIWRHDYHTHIQTMKAYLSMGEIERLSEYLEMLDQDLKDVDTILRTGNVMADAILNSKLSLAKAKGIAINAKAIVPKELRVNDVDLGVLLGNLLDNAIEGCMRTPDENGRFIRVYIAPKKQQLYVCVTNSAFRKEKKVGMRFLTQKMGYHGFGLLRIDRICEKYGGAVTRASEEGAFTSEILLPV